MRFVRRHASALGVLIVAAVAAGLIAAVIHEGDVRAAEIAEQREERLQQVCGSITDNREALIRLTSVVLEGNGASLPLTAIPEFSQLDPATQAYISALESSQVPTGPTVTERIDAFRAGLEAAPLPDFCQ